jgi:hypothetical protein
MARYSPNPTPTHEIVVTPAQQKLIEDLAENTHEIWAAKRMRDGWSWGKQRDDHKKQHPCLVPYKDLPASEQAYDQEIVEQTIKAALAFGYEIRKL